MELCGLGIIGVGKNRGTKSYGAWEAVRYIQTSVRFA
jgi:hypothetical protein